MLSHVIFRASFPAFIFLAGTIVPAQSVKSVSIQLMIAEANEKRIVQAERTSDLKVFHELFEIIIISHFSYSESALNID